MSSIERFEIAKARLSFAAAILHTIDLDGLARIHQRVASPQALVDGFRLAEQDAAENWLAVVAAAQALRDASSFDSEVLAAVEAGLPSQLRLDEEGDDADRA